MGITKGSWNIIKPMEVARSHAPVIAYKGMIYVFGGGGPEFSSLDSCVRYNPTTEEWSDLTPMPTKRSGTAAFLINGKVYVVGGGFKKPDGNFQFLKTVEIYDPETDSWETGPDMNQPHDYPAATLVGETIYILGGHHPEACLGGPKTDPGFDYCERWAPGQASWEEIAPLPTPRFAAAALTRNDTIYTSGGVAFRPEGFNNFDFFENFSLSAGSWSKDENLKLPWPAAGQGMCSVNNDFFFFGGYSTDNIHTRAAVCPEKETEWQRIPDMPMPRAAMGVVVIDSTIYLIGGWEDDGRTPMNSVVAYSWN